MFRRFVFPGVLLISMWVSLVVFRGGPLGEYVHNLTPLGLALCCDDPEAVEYLLGRPEFCTEAHLSQVHATVVSLGVLLCPAPAMRAAT